MVVILLRFAQKLNKIERGKIYERSYGNKRNKFDERKGK